MVTHSALKELAKAAGFIGILLLNPLHANAAKAQKLNLDNESIKSGKTVAASPVTAVSTATPKTSLMSRPCTPINPC